MRIVIAPDSFKGSIHSAPAAAAIAAGLRRLDPTVETVLIPMADGGEGTVEAICTLLGGEIITHTVADPLDRPVPARYGWVAERRLAILEMADASGLPRLAAAELDPLRASTAGTGELLRHALDRGAQEVILGIGGSATNDAGMGFFSALGAVFLDQQGHSLRGCGANLAATHSIDTRNFDSRLSQLNLSIASDVDNPLLGPQGATHVFGPQKGVTEALLPTLEQGMMRFAQVMVEHIGEDYRQHPGAGAAGGFGFSLLSLLPRVRLQSGFQLIAELSQLAETIQNSTLVITGEGKLDSQSLHGKVPVGIARMAQGVPVVAFAGAIDGDLARFQAEGISAVMPIVDAPMPLEYAMANAETLLSQAAGRFWQTLQLGQRLK